MPDTDEAATSWRDRTSLPPESGHSIVSRTTLATRAGVCTIL